MGFADQPTLTGSKAGVPTTLTEPACVALGRLRRGILLCCSIVVLALFGETILWAVVSYTDVRWAQLESSETQPLIVTTERRSPKTGRSALDGPGPSTAIPVTPVDPNLVRTTFDVVGRELAALCRSLGTIAILVLVPLIGLGVQLTVATATPGVDKTVSAFGWVLVVALLALPIGSWLGLPWQDGAFWSYDRLTAEIDAQALAREIGESRSSPITQYAQYLVLPLACASVIGLVGRRFAAGVKAGLMIAEDLTLDSELEREAGNIKSTSLHGGRTAGVMHRAISARANAGPNPLPKTTSLREVAPGDAPRRLI